MPYRYRSASLQPWPCGLVEISEAYQHGILRLTDEVLSKQPSTIVESKHVHDAQTTIVVFEPFHSSAGAVKSIKMNARRVLIGTEVEHLECWLR